MRAAGDEAFPLRTPGGRARLRGEPSSTHRPVRARERIRYGSPSASDTGAGTTARDSDHAGAVARSAAEARRARARAAARARSRLARDPADRSRRAGDARRPGQAGARDSRHGNAPSLDGLPELMPFA